MFSKEVFLPVFVLRNRDRERARKTGSDRDVGHRVGNVFAAQYFFRIFSGSG